jgi:hypothetical protein
MMRVRKLGRRVVQIAAVVALGVGVTLGTSAVLADDAETPASEVVHETPAQSEPAAEETAEGATPLTPWPEAAQVRGIDWE